MKHRIAIALAALSFAGAATPVVAQASSGSDTQTALVAKPDRSSWS